MRCRGSGLLACVAHVRRARFLHWALKPRSGSAAGTESPATVRTPAPADAASRRDAALGCRHLPRRPSPGNPSASATCRAIFRHGRCSASADIVVQTVMVGLAFASLVTWTVWLAKSIELFMARRRLRIALSAISEERSLAGAAARVGNGRGIAASFIAAAAHELRSPPISASATASRSASRRGWPGSRPQPPAT